MNDQPAIRRDSVTFEALDGYRLGGTLLRPHEPARLALLVSGAVAVPHRVYRAIAEYMAGNGAVVLAYDYRGIAASAPKSLAGFNAPMRDWALKDFPAAVDFLRAAAPGLPLALIGHSFGGQALGLSDRNRLFSHALLIAVMSGYWGNMASPEKYRVYAAMNGLVPVISAMAGYVPGRTGIGEDMAWSTFREWARWCRRPGYFFDDPTLLQTRHFADYAGAIRAIRLGDDPWGTPVAIDKLMRHFSHARIEHVTYHPAEVGVKKIGHFGFFRSGHRETLWRNSAEWLFSGL